MTYTYKPYKTSQEGKGIIGVDSNRKISTGEIANAKAIEDLDLCITKIENIRDKYKG